MAEKRLLESAAEGTDSVDALRQTGSQRRWNPVTIGITDQEILLDIVSNPCSASSGPRLIQIVPNSDHCSPQARTRRKP